MSTEETLAVVLHHAKAMRISVDEILADYAPDAVLITNLVDQPIVGHAEVRRLVEATELKSADAPHATVVLREAEGDYLMQVLEDRGRTYVETFVVREGKIVFESVYISERRTP